MNGVRFSGNSRGPNTVQPHEDQYSGVSLASERRQLIMGVDFGTAYTKIVVADNRKARAIPFKGAVGSNNAYLLPSIVSIGKNGCVSLGRTPKWECISNAKLSILAGETQDKLIHASVSFLALAMREARHSFMLTYYDEYSPFQLTWLLNIGLPAEHCRNHDIVDFYRSMARAAWHASLTSGALNVETAEDCFVRDDGPMENHNVGVIPEFVAQICGYVRSPMRREGAHVLMDVGGGTLDIAVFNVAWDREEDRDLFPVFAGSVSLHGVIPLHNHRISRFGGNIDEFDQSRDTEQAGYASSASFFSVSVDILKDVDRPFLKRVQGQFLDVLEKAKRDKYDRLYQQPISLFLCGGGANVEMYSNIVDGLVRAKRPCPLERLSLPQPERFEADGLHNTVYDRLSVAYGLSFDPFEIGTVRLPDEISNTNCSNGAHSVSGMCPACRGSGGHRGNSCLRCGGRGWLS